jgi:hypothetical protein
VYAQVALGDRITGTHRVDWDLLKTVRKITGKLEVADQPPTAWQRAILPGLRGLAVALAARWGIVEGDMDRRSLRFVAPA